MDAAAERLIEQNLELSDFQILERLGRAVYEAPVSAFPPSVNEYVSAARKWLDDRRVRICQALRDNSTISSFMNGQGVYRRAEIVMIVTDLISLALKLPTAGAGWAATAILKHGLNEFCSECQAKK